MDSSGLKDRRIPGGLARWNLSHLWCFLLALFLATSLHAAPPGTMPRHERVRDPMSWVETDMFALPEIEPGQLRWLDQFDYARMSATAQGNTLLVFFSRPDCGWCNRLKNETLNDPSVRERLRRFTLVEIDTTRDRSLAMRYGIRGVPAILWMNTDGRPLHAINGFLTAPDFAAVLDQILSPGGPRDTPAQNAALLRDLAEDAPGPEVLARAVLAMHRADPGGAVRDAVRALDPTPTPHWITLLSDDRLAVRLGALEWLEELAGTAHGFDPWTAPGAPDNLAAVRRWQAWAEDAPASRPRFARLTRDQLETAVRDLEHGTPERVHRATRALETAGPTLRPHLVQLLEREDVSPVLRERLQGVKLTLDVSTLGWTDASGIAHRMRSGPIDSRLNLLREAATRGSASLPVLAAFLDDPEIRVREAVAEALLQAGGIRALPALLPRLEEETSIDVVVTAMRNMGPHASPESEAWLKTQLASENEERILGALEAVRQGRFPGLIDEVHTLLEDPRWRVRAAAIRCLRDTRSTRSIPKLMEHLNDPDEFTRTTLIETVVSLTPSGADRNRLMDRLWKQAETPEETWMLLRVACANNIAPPRELLDGLPDRPRNELLTALGILETCRNGRVEAALALAGHGDPDVRASALRMLARHGLSASDRERRSAEHQLATALVESDGDFRLMLADAIRLPRRASGSGFDSIFGDLLSSADLSTEDEGALADLLQAFGEPGETASEPAGAAPSGGVGLDDLLGAFAEPEPRSPAAEPGGPTLSLTPTLLKLFDETPDGPLREVLARVLVEQGEATPVPYFLERAAHMPAEHIQNVLERAHDNEIATRAALVLLNDSRPGVRRQAVRELAVRAAVDHFLPIVDKLGTEGSPVSSADIPWNDFRVRSALRELPGARTRPFIQSWLADPGDETGAHFTRVSIGLLLALHARDRRHADTVAGLTETLVDPALRAQAWLAHAAHSPRMAPGDFERIAADPSSRVRTLAPFLLISGTSKNHPWHVQPGLAFSVSGGDAQDRWSQRLTDASLPALKTLLDDPMPDLRLFAGAALLSHNHAHSLPPGWADEVSGATPPAHAARAIAASAERLLPRLQNDHLPFARWLERQNLSSRVQLNLENWIETRQRATPEPLEEGEAEIAALAGPEPMDEDGAPPLLLYFYSHGCPECEVAKEMIASHLTMFPETVVREIEVGEPGAMDLYHAIFQTHRLPLTQVGLTPMLASAHGADCGGEALTFDRISELFVGAMDTPGDSWVPRLAPPPEPEPAPAGTVQREARVEPETAPEPGREPSAPKTPRVPGTPLQGILLLVAGILILHQRPLTPPSALAPFGALLVASLLPVPVNPVLAASVLLVLLFLMLDRALRGVSRAEKNSLSTRIRKPGAANQLATRAVPFVGAIIAGLATPLHQWASSLRAPPAWIWIAVAVLTAPALIPPGKFTLRKRPLLTTLGALAMILGGLLAG